MKFVESYYLTEPEALENLIKSTPLDADEVEDIVGRFKMDHWRFPGLLKGEVVVRYDGSVLIRHHFTKQALWDSGPAFE